jgi:hypothetical protein
MKFAQGLVFQVCVISAVKTFARLSHTWIRKFSLGPNKTGIVLIF